MSNTPPKLEAVPAPQQPKPEDDPEVAMLVGLIKGEVPAPNDMAAYLVVRIQGVRAQMNDATAKLEQAHQQVLRLELAKDSLGLQNNGYVEDLRVWMRKAPAPAQVAAPAKKG